MILEVKNISYFFVYSITTCIISDWSLVLLSNKFLDEKSPNACLEVFSVIPCEGKLSDNLHDENVVEVKVQFIAR